MNAEDLVITFKKNMASLSKTERRRAIESVRDVIRAAMLDDAAGSAYEVECCPRCGSVAIVKKGKSKNGEQVHKRGLSGEQICVMTGVNDSNETFFEVSGRGVLSRKRAMDVLRGRIRRTETIK